MERQNHNQNLTDVNPGAQTHEVLDIVDYWFVWVLLTLGIVGGVINSLGLYILFLSFSGKQGCALLEIIAICDVITCLAIIPFEVFGIVKMNSVQVPHGACVLLALIDAWLRYITLLTLVVCSCYILGRSVLQSFPELTKTVFSSILGMVMLFGLVLCFVEFAGKPTGLKLYPNNLENVKGIAMVDTCVVREAILIELYKEEMLTAIVGIRSTLLLCIAIAMTFTLIVFLFLRKKRHQKDKNVRPSILPSPSFALPYVDNGRLVDCVETVVNTAVPINPNMEGADEVARWMTSTMLEDKKMIDRVIEMYNQSAPSGSGTYSTSVIRPSISSTVDSKSLQLLPSTYSRSRPPVQHRPAGSYRGERPPSPPGSPPNWGVPKGPTARQFNNNSVQWWREPGFFPRLTPEDGFPPARGLCGGNSDATPLPLCVAQRAPHRSSERAEESEAAPNDACSRQQSRFRRGAARRKTPGEEGVRSSEGVQSLFIEGVEASLPLPAEQEDRRHQGDCRIDKYAARPARYPPHTVLVAWSTQTPAVEDQTAPGLARVGRPRQPPRNRRITTASSTSPTPVAVQARVVRRDYGCSRDREDASTCGWRCLYRLVASEWKSAACEGNDTSTAATATPGRSVARAVRWKNQDGPAGEDGEREVFSASSEQHPWNPSNVTGRGDNDENDSSHKNNNDTCDDDASNDKNSDHDDDNNNNGEDNNSDHDDDNNNNSDHDDDNSNNSDHDDDNNNNSDHDDVNSNNSDRDDSCNNNDDDDKNNNSHHDDSSDNHDDDDHNNNDDNHNNSDHDDSSSNNGDDKNNNSNQDDDNNNDDDRDDSCNNNDDDDKNNNSDHDDSSDNHDDDDHNNNDDNHNNSDNDDSSSNNGDDKNNNSNQDDDNNNDDDDNNHSDNISSTKSGSADNICNNRDDGSGDEAEDSDIDYLSGSSSDSENNEDEEEENNNFNPEVDEVPPLHKPMATCQAFVQRNKNTLLPPSTAMHRNTLDVSGETSYDFQCRTSFDTHYSSAMNYLFTGPDQQLNVRREMIFQRVLNRLRRAQPTESTVALNQPYKASMTPRYSQGRPMDESTRDISATVIVPYAPIEDDIMIMSFVAAVLVLLSFVPICISYFVTPKTPYKRTPNEYLDDYLWTDVVYVHATVKPLFYALLAPKFRFRCKKMFQEC